MKFKGYDVGSSCGSISFVLQLHPKTGYHNAHINTLSQRSRTPHGPKCTIKRLPEFSDETVKRLRLHTSQCNDPHPEDSSTSPLRHLIHSPPPPPSRREPGRRWRRPGTRQQRTHKIQRLAPPPFASTVRADIAPPTAHGQVSWPALLFRRDGATTRRCPRGGR